MHCIKSAFFSELFWFSFSRIRTEYRDLTYQSPYSVQMGENTDQKAPNTGTFHDVMNLNFITPVIRIQVFVILVAPYRSKIIFWEINKIYSNKPRH